MTDRPLLKVPEAIVIDPPPGQGFGPKLTKPGHATQVERFSPVFERLRQFLNEHPHRVLELKDDPTSLAPERVIVFEIAGSVANFAQAVNKIPGLELIFEFDLESQPPDEFFALLDDGGQAIAGKNVPGCFYLSMPDTRAFQELLSLWEKWRQYKKLDSGFAPFSHVFEQLRMLRPWGPKDRIPIETVEYWQELMEFTPDSPVRTEVDLWFRQDQLQRNRAFEKLEDIIEDINGEVIQQVIVSEIAYHGVLIDIPPESVWELVDRQEVHLALIDEVMFYRPQGQIRYSTDWDEIEEPEIEIIPEPPQNLPPIVALLDGVPISGHRLLQQRVEVDDPENLEERALVERRVHGTAMASLISHGDLNSQETPLSRPLYIRPILISAGDSEHTEDSKLLVDTVYRAVRRIKGDKNADGVSPEVFIINLSIGDRRRPFARLMSPLARLLDFLAYKYNILFVVSGGNIPKSLPVDGFNNWTEFEDTNMINREEAVLRALDATRFERSLLSPAESINAITVGAQHCDNVTSNLTSSASIDPYSQDSWPNVSSALGLGYRKSIKPEILLPGGRELVQIKRSNSGLEIVPKYPQRLFGLRAASPDTSNQGRLSQTTLISGTSAATAIATRAAHRIFDALISTDTDTFFSEVPRELYAVLIKTLLVHRACWRPSYKLLKDICGPAEPPRHEERSENASSFVGFGIPKIHETTECNFSRATLVGHGTISSDCAHSYEIPIPNCLQRTTARRFLAVSVAWFSPINPRNRRYRGTKIEIKVDKDHLGVERMVEQPSRNLTRRGTVLHELFEGNKAIPSTADCMLPVKIACSSDGSLGQGMINYGLAITIESPSAMPIYDELKEILRIAPRPAI